MTLLISIKKGNKDVWKERGKTLSFLSPPSKLICQCFLNEIPEKVPGDVITSFLRQYEAGRNPVISWHFGTPPCAGVTEKAVFSEIS